ncbi:O-antigen ligase family protein [Chungangia koreensis]|uniref:O-antigen ligase family protein n=1 Tax=Chungangia koreensis TaxID=752657 RepID=A0ABV8X6V2_9LACT
MVSKYYLSNHSLSDEEEDIHSRKNIDNWIFRLLLLIIGFLPLIIGAHATEVISPKLTTINLVTSGMKGDTFTFYKMLFLIAVTTIIVILFLSKIFFMNGTIKATKMNYFLITILLFIIVSTLFSPSKTIALWGQFNRSDGGISYICYLVLFFVAMNLEFPKKALNYIMYSLYPLILINFILITMNFYGKDALQYNIVEKLMTIFLPSEASLNEGSTLMGTLNQWNYMSGMFAIMTVMFLTWSLFDKNLVRSIINMIISVFSLSIMLMSLSTSGFLTVLQISLIIIYIVIRSDNRKKSLVLLLSFFILSLPIFHVLAKENPRVWNESIGFIIKDNPYIHEQASTKTSYYKIDLTNKAFAAENSFELPKLPASGLAPGSGRLYIWEKTFNLIQERPLLGYGLDTLMYHFPHYNIDARAGMRTEHTIVDKPHNMYIGVLYGTGIVGLIGFMGLIVITAFSALKGLFKTRNHTISVLSIGWLAFLIQAMFNDSLPGTSAPMWTLAGIMMAIILTQKEQLKESTDGRNN